MVWKEKMKEDVVRIPIKKDVTRIRAAQKPYPPDILVMIDDCRKCTD